jgi:hypothetical protein
LPRATAAPWPCLPPTQRRGPWRCGTPWKFRMYPALLTSGTAGRPARLPVACHGKAPGLGVVARHSLARFGFPLCVETCGRGLRCRGGRRGARIAVAAGLRSGALLARPLPGSGAVVAQASARWTGSAEHGRRGLLTTACRLSLACLAHLAATPRHRLAHPALVEVVRFARWAQRHGPHHDTPCVPDACLDNIGLGWGVDVEADPLWGVGFDLHFVTALSSLSDSWHGAAVSKRAGRTPEDARRQSCLVAV